MTGSVRERRKIDGMFEKFRINVLVVRVLREKRREKDFQHAKTTRIANTEGEKNGEKKHVRF